MPHSSSEQSLVTNCHPVLMGNSDILVKDEFGQSNPLEVSDYTSRNGELVNLENACVNIDNSSDVIIGPVTQFNVNGNVTIYQNENGQQRPADEGGTDTDTRESSYDGQLRRKQRKTSWIHLIFLTLVHNRQIVRNFLILSIVMILVLITSSLLIKKFVHQVLYDDNFNDTFYGNVLGNHSVFYRKDWGGRPPKMNTMYLKHCVPLLIISHSDTEPCFDIQECSGKIRYLQKDHQININTLDIAMNFLIGGDGNIYVGRGWDIENYRRKNSLLFSFIGDYVYDTLTETMINATQLLISQGLQLGKLCPDYEIVGENQTTPKKVSESR
nr:peptidoglycan-recognition protein LA-like [Leptinotarsa decemlineata]